MSPSDPAPRSAFLSPLFLTSAVILLAAAFGLQPAIAGLIRWSSKEPIDLRRKLDQLDPAQLPSYRALRDDGAAVRPSQTDDLGTDDYIEMLLEEREPGDGRAEQALLFVTYYSDPRDAIPHTPEVCYRQAGGVVNRDTRITVPTPGLGPAMPQVRARLLDLDLAGRQRAVLYVICCNGKMFASRESARWEIGLPGDEHIYFSKIETVSQCSPGESFEDAVARCKTLFAEALPILVEEYFPTREQVSGDVPES